MVRIWSLAALAVAIWLLGAYRQSRPVALDLDAPGTRFSAARANAALARVLGPERPHPVGSSENAALHARLLKELAAIGVPARTVTAMSCYSETRWGAVECATVGNIMVEVSAGSGKAVLLMAHMDSVAAGPGACDDGCGVATLLETIRALKARGTAGGHPIKALFSDGEEAGLLGAAAYLRDPAARAATGVVINVEARGNQGVSYLFQTSPGDAKLIDLYARSVPRYAASSLYGEIYKFLPNDTDLTPFLQAGIPGYNFALVGQVAHYHTALDRRSNIDLRGLQQHGDNALELAQALSRTDPAQLKGGNAVYLDILGRWLPRLGAAWALPLSILAFVLIALAGLFTQREQGQSHHPWRALLVPPVFLAASIAIGLGLHGIAAAISGHVQPAYANALWMRLSLGFGLFTVALLVARGATGVATWLWFSGLAITTSLWAPGASPYFLFPALLAAPLLLGTVRAGRGAALLAAAMGAMLVWLGLCAGTEPLLGIDVQPIFTATAAFGLLTLLPVLGRARTGWRLSVALSLLAALGLAVAAGLQPAFSPTAPQRLDIHYAEQDGRAWWLASPVKGLPSALRAAAGFSPRPQRMIEKAYVAPAGAARNRPPAATVLRQGDQVIMTLDAPSDGVILRVPQEARLQAVTVQGQTVAAPPGRVSIICASSDCGSARLALKLGSQQAVRLTLLSLKHGLPLDGAKLLKARPAMAVASQEGDGTVLAATLAIPAR